MKFDWKKSLAAVAPTVATALGGPLAGVAISVATQALGIENNEEELVKAISTGNPDVFLKLKEAENTLKIKLKELDIKESEIDASDRASAREREAKVGGIITPTLGTIVVVGFFCIIAYVLVAGLDVAPAVATMIGMLVGQVSSKAEQVMNYYFGSSAGSRRKNELIKSNIEDINKGS